MSTIKLLQLMFLSVIIVLFYSTNIFAQTKCTNPSGYTNTINGKTLTTEWKPVPFVKSYRFEIAFNNKTSSVNVGPSTKYSNSIPGGTYVIEYRVANLCPVFELDTTIIFAAQADINSNAAMCAEVNQYPLTDVHLVSINGGKAVQMTGQEIVDQLCPTLTGGGVGGNTNRLATLSPTTVSPNPFTETTTLNFQLTKSSDVRIQMFDTKGQQYELEFTNKIMEAGAYNLPINGQELSVGVYYIRLTINGEATVHKLMKIE